MKTTIAKALAACLLVNALPLVAGHYYINSITGLDTNPGTDSAAPWKSMTPVQAKTFLPGDTVNLARGSSWTKAAWEFVLLIDNSGTATNPIVFRAYGAGEKPRFSNSGKWNKGIGISASYVILEDVLVTSTGYSGIELVSGAGHNIVRNCEVCSTGIAVYVNQNCTRNLLTKNYVHDLTPIVDDTGPNCSLPRTDPQWTRDPCDNDFGATVFWLNSPSNEISYNRAVDNRMHSYDYQYDGGFLEFYNDCDSTYVHHNWVDVGMGVMEASNGHATDVRVAYNVFIELKGLFAPHYTLTNFMFENNTCITREGTLWNNMLMTPESMVIRNNIFVLGGDASERVASTNSFTHLNNLYYLLDGSQMGSVTMGTTEESGDPKFVNATGKDFQLQSGSPAINAGVSLGYALDFVDKPVPTGAAPDMGAYEFQPLTRTQSPLAAVPAGFQCEVIRTSAREITVGYSLPRSEDVSIQLFDLRGKMLRSVVFSRQSVGYHEATIDMSGSSSGCLAIRMKAGADHARIGWALSGK